MVGKEQLNIRVNLLLDNEATLKGRTPWDPPWKCKGRFFKVDRPPHFTPLKYLSEATERDNKIYKL